MTRDGWIEWNNVILVAALAIGFLLGYAAAFL